MNTSRIRAGLTFEGADGTQRRVVAFLEAKAIVTTISDGRGVAVARSAPVTTVTYADGTGALRSTTLMEFAKWAVRALPKAKGGSSRG